MPQQVCPISDRKQYAVIDLKQLREHEFTLGPRLCQLTRDIKENKYVTPILVDSEHSVILDGHHRYNVLKSLGFKHIPAILVDYSSSDIKVSSRKKRVKVTKEIVIRRALSGKLFPPKTSRHILTAKCRLKVPLTML